VHKHKAISLFISYQKTLGLLCFNVFQRTIVDKHLIILSCFAQNHQLNNVSECLRYFATKHGLMVHGCPWSWCMTRDKTPQVLSSRLPVTCDWTLGRNSTYSLVEVDEKIWVWWRLLSPPPLPRSWPQTNDNLLGSHYELPGRASLVFKRPFEPTAVLLSISVANPTYRQRTVSILDPHTHIAGESSERKAANILAIQVDSHPQNNVDLGWLSMFLYHPEALSTWNGILLFDPTQLIRSGIYGRWLVSQVWMRWQNTLKDFDSICRLHWKKHTCTGIFEISTLNHGGQLCGPMSTHSHPRRCAG
jgi:hypothetical protein